MNETSHATFAHLRVKRPIKNHQRQQFILSNLLRTYISDCVKRSSKREHEKYTRAPSFCFNQKSIIRNSFSRCVWLYPSLSLSHLAECFQFVCTRLTCNSKITKTLLIHVCLCIASINVFHFDRPANTTNQFKCIFIRITSTTTGAENKKKKRKYSNKYQARVRRHTICTTLHRTASREG